MNLHHDFEDHFSMIVNAASCTINLNKSRGDDSFSSGNIGESF